MRKVQLVEGEYYHIFNRGVDKRTVFQDSHDFNRFLLSLVGFNSVEPIGSIYEYSLQEKSKFGNRVSKSLKSKEKEPLVDIVAYVLNKNHFCKKDIILGQFKNVKEYKQMAEGTVKEIKNRRDLEHLMFD